MCEFPPAASICWRSFHLAWGAANILDAWLEVCGLPDVRIRSGSIEKHRVAVLGAGISGLQAGLGLLTRGVDFTILESAGTIGGLARTTEYKQWRYDFGVKALYSRNAAIMDYVRSLPIEYAEHQREARVHHCSAGSRACIDIDYPFENGIGQLPHEDKVACVLGYLEAFGSHKPFDNFYEWVINRLGSGIATQFMLPYNSKIWDCPLEEIGLGLVAGKIDPAPIEEILRVALGEKIVGRPYQSRFIYPRAGLSAMTDAMALPIRDRIRLNFEVRQVIARDAGYDLVSAVGDRVHSDSIISTLPLPRLGSLIEPGEWPQPNWRHNNTLFCIVFLNQAPANGLHWHFFAAPEFPFYRLTYMHNFSDRFPPCVVAEITDRGQPVDTEQVTRALGRIGVERSWVEEVRVERLGFTYPIPTLRSDAEKPRVIDFFESRHIYPMGRAGSWNYANVDGIIAQAWERIPVILERERLV
jgi:protoporphyrinogen oxidase